MFKVGLYGMNGNLRGHLLYEIEHSSAVLIKDFAKVRDEVEENLVKEGDNVRLWQMRLKTAMEQVEHTI